VISVVVGNPKPRSRTARVAEAVAEVLAGATGLGPIRLLDLAELSASLLDWNDEEVRTLTAEVAASELVVVASPTYKAAYSGLLKLFLDRYGTNGLEGVVAVPVMVGASPVHALAPEAHLRPLLVELGASVPSRALYVLEGDIESGLDSVVQEWFAHARTPLVRATGGDRQPNSLH
jgi:FMN reductase